ncbi:MAG: 4Fe-4S dicluster domain-containing protein [Candidatus Firestonebacteria bacterium]
MSGFQKVSIDREKCKSCGYCILYCNKNNLSLSKSFNARGYLYVEFNDKEGKCNSCALCAIMCPEAAIKVRKEEKK